MWDKVKSYINSGISKAKKVGDYLKKTGREMETDIHSLVSKKKK